ncbi:MAG: hypothetical protein L6300_00815 [Syntrophaceae bacterium]|nr:hypothetical protein [Pseudomonadota bacterium]MCG2738765.1 hypothetical protein [Syntrophaceae bacterium]
MGGVVSTANYEARKYGVHSAMPMKTAYKMCPHAVFLPVDYEAYSSASVIFKDVLRTVSPIMEDVGIDEAYLDVTDMPDTIKIRFSDFETFTRAMTICDYTDSEEEIRKSAFACLKRIELKKKVRLVGVRASNFQGKNKDDQRHSEVPDRLIFPPLLPSG